MQERILPAIASNNSVKGADSLKRAVFILPAKRMPFSKDKNYCFKMQGTIQEIKSSCYLRYMKRRLYAALLTVSLIANGCRGRYVYVCTCHVNNQDTIYRAATAYDPNYDQAKFTCDSIQQIYHPDSCTLSKQVQGVPM